MGKIFLLTGGTGFVGSFLAIELLKRGNFVIFLARRKKPFKAEERVRRILHFIDPDVYESMSSFFRVVEADITKPNLDLSYDDFNYLQKVRPHAVFHCAASVDFDSGKSRLVRLINCQGTSNVLKLATEIESLHFHHISSLYVAGKREGTIFESELMKGQQFNNVYEQSKAESELLVQKWAKETKRSFSIYRLPIVIGDSFSGKTLSYTGFYAFFKPFWGVKKSIKEKMPSKKFDEAGIYAKDGCIFAPLFVKCFKKSRIDLLPIDWITKNICALIKKDISGLTFHFSHSSPPSSEEIIKMAFSVIGLNGFRFIVNGNKIESNHQNSTLKAYQRIIDRLTGEYFDYNANKKLFDFSNLKLALGSDYSLPPEINKILRIELKYAVEKEFKPFS